MDATALTKHFASRLSTMVESGLVTYRHYIPWADELIVRLDKPPYWVLELSTTKYRPRALEVLGAFVSAPPFEPFDWAAQTDEHVACLLLRYRRGEISWATFLTEAGQELDSGLSGRPCEGMFAMLNELEAREYSESLEAVQRAVVERDFQGAVERIEPVYATFAEAFRRSASKSAE